MKISSLDNGWMYRLFFFKIKMSEIFCFSLRDFEHQSPHSNSSTFYPQHQSKRLHLNSVKSERCCFDRATCLCLSNLKDTAECLMCCQKAQQCHIKCLSHRIVFHFIRKPVAPPDYWQTISTSVVMWKRQRSPLFLFFIMVYRK